MSKPKKLPNPLDFFDSKTQEFEDNNYVVYAILILCVVLVYVLIKVVTG